MLSRNDVPIFIRCVICTPMEIWNAFHISIQQKNFSGDLFSSVKVFRNIHRWRNVSRPRFSLLVKPIETWKAISVLLIFVNFCILFIVCLCSPRWGVGFSIGTWSPKLIVSSTASTSTAGSSTSTSYINNFVCLLI